MESREAKTTPWHSLDSLFPSNGSGDRRPSFSTLILQEAGAPSPSRPSPLALFSLAAEELRKLQSEALDPPQEGPETSVWHQMVPGNFSHRLLREGRWPRFNSLPSNSGCCHWLISLHSLWNSAFIPQPPPACSALLSSTPDSPVLLPIPASRFMRNTGLDGAHPGFQIKPFHHSVS